jgi:hypothetical protein
LFPKQNPTDAYFEDPGSFGGGQGLSYNGGLLAFKENP